VNPELALELASCNLFTTTMVHSNRWHDWLKQAGKDKSVIHASQRKIQIAVNFWIEDLKL
jgi:hypothetical protein